MKNNKLWKKAKQKILNEIKIILMMKTTITPECYVLFSVCFISFDAVTNYIEMTLQFIMIIFHGDFTTHTQTERDLHSTHLSDWKEIAMMALFAWCMVQKLWLFHVMNFHLHKYYLVDFIFIYTNDANITIIDVWCWRSAFFCFRLSSPFSIMRQ